MNPAAESNKLSASGIITSKAAILTGMNIGTDGGANDPTITVYNGISTNGTEVIPTTTYDSSALGLNGENLSFAKKCPNGIYVEISGDATVEVVIDWIPMEQ